MRGQPSTHISEAPTTYEKHCFHKSHHAQSCSEGSPVQLPDVHVTRHEYESHSWWGADFDNNCSQMLSSLDPFITARIYWVCLLDTTVPGEGQCSQEESRPSMIMCTCMLSFFSHVQLFMTLTPSPPRTPPPYHHGLYSAGSSVHGILQARILEWVAISLSRGSSWSRGQNCVSYVSCLGSHVLY